MDSPIHGITIRPFKPQDRAALRTICYETSFLGHPRFFCDNQEIVADVLSIYFTDYEPESCFVADDGKMVIGYVMGTKNARQMHKIFLRRIFPGLILKSLCLGVFCRVKTWQFLFNGSLSFLKGEFWMPPVRKRYRALVHINIDKDFRRHGIGHLLVEHYLRYLKEHKIPGVFISTMSEQGKVFFVKQGFQVLFKGKKTFLRYRLGEDAPQ